MSAPRAIIFDCDGVLVDSEVLAQQVLIDLLAEHRCPLTHDECQARFMGKTIDGVVAIIADLHSRAIADIVARELTPRTIEAFATRLQPVPHVADVLERLTLPRALATSSAPERAATSLRVTNLARHFGEHVYTAFMVPNPKPAPDVYLLAAQRLGIDPAACLVVEDSPGGVRAGVAAGMRVIGFTGTAHTTPLSARMLLDAGASEVISDMRELLR